jgi:hypothetical protein
VARAEPDGYTILMGTVATHALNPGNCSTGDENGPAG